MLVDFTSTYRNKRVFLTGHTGFKGSWMSVWLSMLGANVKGYALKPEKRSLYNQIFPHLKKHESVFADIRNQKKLTKELLAFQPDFIFHMAAQAIVRKSYYIPVETFETNAIGTANLLDSVRSLKRKCIVIILTTDKVYSNNEKGIPFSESDSLGGHDPYSASKAAAEIITDSFRLSFFNPDTFALHKKSVATARAGNVIGGGDYSVDRILPDIFRALSKNVLIPVRNPNAVRPWQHVLEPLSGYLTLGACMNENPVKFSTSFNFGPLQKDSLKVIEVVNMSIMRWGSGKYKIIKKENKSPHEAGILKLNISKAKKEIGWKPKWNSEYAIEKTIQWYKNSINKKSDIYYLCMNEINDFIK